MQKTGGKQSTLKKMNRKLILSFIGKEKLSCADLAHKSGLSYTGVITVVDGLVKDKIVKKTDAEITSLGRRPIWVEMDHSYGMVCAVAFANPAIAFYSLDGECLHMEKHPYSSSVTRENIDEIIARIQKLCKEKFDGIKLLHVCVAVPGKVDKKTGGFVFAPNFIDYKNMNLKDIFGERLNVGVTVKNDMRFWLYAEKMCGKMKNKICDTLYLQFGRGFGCALFLENKLYEGGCGHGGEIGMFITDYNAGILSDSGNNTFQQLCSYDRLVSAAKADKRYSETVEGEITLQRLADDYERGNLYVCRLVDEFAGVVANVIKSLAIVIDFDSVFITKQSLAFGDRFLSLLSEKVNVGGAYPNVGIYEASLGSDGVLLGAKYYAVQSAIDLIS